MSEKLSYGIRVNADLTKRGANLSRGPNLQKKLTAAAWSNTFPAPGATLDLDFANNRGFVRGVGQGGAMDAVTFTRASSGNWVDSTGTLRTGAGSFAGTANAEGKNLLTFPQDFDNTIWSKVYSSITSNTTTAPDGTSTADSYIESNTTNVHQITQGSIAVSTSSPITFSVYAKYSGRFIQMAFGSGDVTGNPRANFDIQNGVLGSVDAAITATITSVGNGWYRCTATATPVVTTGFNVILNTISTITATRSENYTGDGYSGIYIWGAQLEVGSSATTYYPTNINVPRFDWASTAQTARENQFFYTEDFSNAYWNENNAVTITTAAGTAPDGKNTANLIVPNSGTVNARIGRLTAGTNGVRRVYSFYAKANGVRYLSINTSSFYYGSVYDLVDGVCLSPSAGFVVSSTITDAGNGWWRISHTTAIGTFPCIIAGTSYTQLGTAGTATFNGTDGFYLWGAQWENNTTTLTSYQANGAYIPTNIPLAATSTCNGLLIEESRANRLLWCRDASQTPNRNFVAYSEQFDNAYWSKQNVTISANTAATTDPLGGNTADLMYPSSSGTFREIYRGNINGGGTSGGFPYVMSIYAKAGGLSWLKIAISDVNSSGAWFDLTNGVVGTKGTAVVSSAITSIGNGWYRCSVVTSSIPTNYVVFAVTDADASDTATASGTNGIYLWGSQVDYNTTTLSAYEQTTTTACIWQKINVTVTKTQTGIDGVANSASALTASADGGTCIQIISLASGSRTGSVYLKRIYGTGNIQVTLNGSTWSTVDLSNGLWNRIVLSGTVTNPCVGIKIATNGDAVAMDFGQIEDGAFVTSPILTTTASVTRAADVASMSGQNFIGWYNSTAGTVYLNCQLAQTAGSTSYVYPGSIAASNAYAILALYSGNRLITQVPATVVGVSLIYTQAVKTAFSYTIGQEQTVALSGATYNTNITTQMTSADRLIISGGVYGGAIYSGTVKRITYYPKRLNNNAITVLIGGST